jgi:hypothetical protein
MDPMFRLENRRRHSSFSISHSSVSAAIYQRFALIKG